jgi:hypothetical protein
MRVEKGRCKAASTAFDAADVAAACRPNPLLFTLAWRLP